MRESELESTLWDIVRKVAEDKDMFDSQGKLYCLYCDGYYGHEKDCIVTKSRALAEKGILAW